jgi:signal transduction histidine kinase
MLMDDPGLTGNAYYKQLLSKIHSGTLRLHEIIDAMLDVAKIDARDLHLDTRPVALADVLEAVCTDLKKPAGERNQEITVEDLRILPPVEADASALRKVFYHLVINAVKFTPDGGKINIFGRVLEPNLTDLPEGGVEVVIRDTGIGIDPRFQELIFVKFYQTGELALHSTGKTKFKGGGPGLGLAIANGIIAAHQGRIWVESPGYDEKKCPGSQFHVVLPLRQQEISDYRPSELLVKN